MEQLTVVERHNWFKKVHVSKDAGSKTGADVALTLDFAGCTIGKIAELAARTVVITLQSRWRKVLKDGGEVPKELTVKVVSFETGPTLEEMLASMPAEARKALLEKYAK